MGREVALNGKTISGVPDVAGTNFVFVNYDATYPGGNNTRFIAAGIYSRA